MVSALEVPRENMRIAQVSPYGTPVSGITQMIAELSRQLWMKGFRMALWSPGTESPDRLLEPVFIRIRGRVARNTELAIRTFFGLVRGRSGFDIVHCHQVHPQTIAALLAARILGRGAILTCHARPPEVGLIARFAGDVEAKLATGLASRLVTVSNRIQSDFPGHPWTIIPNGVSISREVSSDEVQKNGPREAHLKMDLLFAGRVTATKGIFTLLRAIALTRESNRDVQLVTFGPVDSPLEYAEAKHQLGIADLVVDRGFSPFWRRELRQGQTFVLPSEYEGLPLSMLEAMAAGLPVIATPVGGIPDILIPHQTGLVVPIGDPRSLADAITWMVDHPAERLAMGANARRLINASFRADKMADRYSQVYRDAGKTSRRINWLGS